MAFVDELKSMPIAIETAAANEQHYEVRMNLTILEQLFGYCYPRDTHVGEATGAAQAA